MSLSESTANDLLAEPQAKPSLAVLLVMTLHTLVMAVFMSPLWSVYIIARCLWGRPPNVPHLSQARRYLYLAWVVQPPEPGLSVQARYWLTLSIVRQFVLTPLPGLAWLLDEILYGRLLNETAVVAPLFVMSVGRSGSTQMTRYLETDENVMAPHLLQCMFPYLWLWKLAPITVGRIFSQAQVRAKLEAMLPPELLERHELDPFRADTFDGAFLSSHLNHLAVYLGPEISSKEFHFAKFSDCDRENMAHDFVQLVDRIGRKQQLFSAGKATTPRRFFLKGHFLYGAEALAHQYPDATFLTLIRDPVERIQSAINFLRVNPRDPSMGPPPWGWLTESLRRTQSEYCRFEQEWYDSNHPASGAKERRCVVRFTDFRDDLVGTMQRVYDMCLQQSVLPSHVPREHPPRERKHYTVNYSLAELGIDADELREELKDYVAWYQRIDNKSEAAEQSNIAV